MFRKHTVLSDGCTCLTPVLLSAAKVGQVDPSLITRITVDKIEGDYFHRNIVVTLPSKIGLRCNWDQKAWVITFALWKLVCIRLVLNLIDVLKNLTMKIHEENASTCCLTFFFKRNGRNFISVDRRKLCVMELLFRLIWERSVVSSKDRVACCG